MVRAMRETTLASATALALFFASSSQACPTHTDGFGATSHLWSKPDQLTVCFVDQPRDLTNPALEIDPTTLDKDGYLDLRKTQFVSFPDELKADIEKEVTHSFSTSPLKFIGWKKCSETPEAKVWVGFSKEAGVDRLTTAQIGDPSKYNYRKSKTLIRINLGFLSMNQRQQKGVNSLLASRNVAINEALNEQFWRDYNFAPIVHEFGHVAGLHHEHFRKETVDYATQMDFTSPQYPFSKKLIGQSRAMQRSLKTDKSDDMVAIGAFDPLSLMNYSSLNTGIAMYLLKSQCLTDPSLDTKLCDLTKIDRLITHVDPVRGYLSAGDLEALHFMYNETPLMGAWQEESNQLVTWMSEIKKAYFDL